MSLIDPLPHLSLHLCQLRPRTRHPRLGARQEPTVSVGGIKLVGARALGLVEG